MVLPHGVLLALCARLHALYAKPRGIGIGKVGSQCALREKGSL